MCVSTQVRHVWRGETLRRVSIQFRFIAPRWESRTSCQDESLRVRCCNERVPIHYHQVSHGEQGIGQQTSVTCKGCTGVSLPEMRQARVLLRNAFFLALTEAVIAHAAWWAWRGDTILAVFDLRCAYFHAEEKRDTFVEVLDYLLAEVRFVVRTRPVATWGDALGRGHELWTSSRATRSRPW